MDARFDFPDGTLSTEHQALVETLNQFLVTLSDDEHQKVVIRLCMELLELANVASQENIARAAGYSPRTLRFYKQRLRDEGLDGLFDHPIPGRPSVTAQPAVEGAVVQAILEAVITQHSLPDDATLAEAVNRHLEKGQDPLNDTTLLSAGDRHVIVVVGPEADAVGRVSQALGSIELDNNGK